MVVVVVVVIVVAVVVVLVAYVDGLIGWMSAVVIFDAGAGVAVAVAFAAAFFVLVSVHCCFQ